MNAYRPIQRPEKIEAETVSPRPGKRPYQKPAFRFEQIFETMALSCGKMSGSAGQKCHMNRKNS